MNFESANSRTAARIRRSISLRVALAGLGLIVVGAIMSGGVWSGIAGLLGLYFILLSVVFFAIIELLRTFGY